MPDEKEVLPKSYYDIIQELKKVEERKLLDYYNGNSSGIDTDYRNVLEPSSILEQDIYPKLYPQI